MMILTMSSSRTRRTPLRSKHYGRVSGEGHAFLSHGKASYMIKEWHSEKGRSLRGGSGDDRISE